MAQTKVKLISDGVIVQGNLHASHGITTAHIGEGSNLYYTDVRVGSYLSTNSFATESYVGTQIASLVDSSPSALNTLNELAAALGDDANFSTTVTNSIALKAPLASPSFTGSVRVSNATQSNYWLYNAAKTNGFLIGRSLTSNDGQDFFIFDTVANSASMTIDSSQNTTFAGNVTLSGNLTLNANGTNFTHGYSGNGLVLSHHGIGPSNAIVSGDASNPDNLYINNSGAASDWTNVVVGGNLNTNTVQISNGVNYDENIRMFPGSNDYSSIIIGAVSGTSGTGVGQWSLVRYPSATHSNKFSIRHNVTDTIVITKEGRVGVSITPSDWNTTALQAGQGSISQDVNSVYVGANTYNASTGWKRINAQLAGYMRMGTNDGIWSFSNAVTGTANSIINWNERMRIQANGNVGIGSSVSSDIDEGKLLVNGTLVLDQTSEIKYGKNNGGPYLNLRSKDGTTSACGIRIHSAVGSPGYIYGEGAGTSTSIMILDGAGHSVFSATQGNNTQIRVNNQTHLYINNSGNIGIGETLPSSRLTVRKDSAGGRGGEISIVNYASNTIGNEAALNFGLEASTYAGDAGNAQIKATVMAANAASDMVFSTWNGSSFGERMRITSAGRVAIKNKPNSGLAYDVLISVGTGADGDVGYQTVGQLAANIDVELLDNYEEGTFTPRLQAASGGQATHQTQSGYYTKIGNVVTCTGTYRWSGNGSNANTTTKIEGFPFVAANVSNNRAAGSMGAVNGIAQGDTLRLVMDPGHAGPYIIQQNSNNYSHNNSISASGDIYGFTITYRTS